MTSAPSAFATLLLVAAPSSGHTLTGLTSTNCHQERGCKNKATQACVPQVPHWTKGTVETLAHSLFALSTSCGAEVIEPKVMGQALWWPLGRVVVSDLVMDT